jgi:hypothetical protein
MENQKKLKSKYYEEHQDKIKARMYEKIECPKCLCNVTRCNMPKHQRTNKCKVRVHIDENDHVSKLVNELVTLKKIENKTEEIKKRLEEIYEELHNI